MVGAHGEAGWPLRAERHFAFLKGRSFPTSEHHGFGPRQLCASVPTDEMHHDRLREAVGAWATVYERRASCRRTSHTVSSGNTTHCSSGARPMPAPGTSGIVAR